MLYKASNFVTSFVEWIDLAYAADMQRSCEHGNAGQLNLFCNAGTLAHFCKTN